MKQKPTKNSNCAKRRFIQSGFLLPAVVGLGLAISTVSILALQLVAENSRTLSGQSYTLIAKEAAQAGVAAAISCINSQDGNRVWGTGGASGTDVLTPRGCTTTTNKDYVIGDADAALASTFRVSPVEDVNSGTETSSIITSTGIVTIKTPDGSRIEVARQTVRTQFKTAGTTVGDPAKKNVVQVSTNNKTSCAVTADDAINDYWVYCWGNNNNMQLGAGRHFANGRSVVPVAVHSAAHTGVPGTCTGGWLFGNCLGWNPSATPAQPASPMAGKRAVKVSVGNTHTCAIAQDGTDDTTRRAYCWGKNNYGQLGNGSSTDSLIPVAVDTSGAQPAVTTIPNPCGGWFQPSCTPVVSVPAKPASALMNKTIVDISAGSGFTCALSSDGLVSCWGLNSDGQLGNNSTTNSNVPVAVSRASGSALASTTVSKLATLKGAATTMCVITVADDAVCWGKSDVGQTGNGAYIDPTNRSGSDTRKHGNPNRCNTLRSQSLSASKSRAGGSPHADSDALIPVAVVGGHKFDSIIVNDSSQSGDSYEEIEAGTGTGRRSIKGSSTAYVTAKTTANRVYYWGGTRSFDAFVDCVRNSDTAGGDSSRASSGVQRNYTGTSTPAIRYNGTSGTLHQAPLGLISGNAFNAPFCATTNGNLYCDNNGSDYNRDGQMGDGRVISCFIWCSPSPSSGPTLVSTTQLPGDTDTSSTHTSHLTTAMAQSISSLDTSPHGYSCAVSGANLTVLCWGTNDQGQLGVNSTNKRFAPTYVYTGDTAGLGKVASGGGGGTVGASGIAAIGTSNGLLLIETAKSF